MSIATELTALSGHITNAYDAVNAKGGTIPANKNMANLSTAISSIETGGGEYSCLPREVSAAGVYQFPSEPFTFSLPSDATDIGPYALQSAFEYCTTITSADLSSLTTACGQYGLSHTFDNCYSLTSVDLSSLITTVGTDTGEYSMQYIFYNCWDLTSVNLGSLTTVGPHSLSNAFYGCRSLTTVGSSPTDSVNLGSLTTVRANGFSVAFRGCTSLTSAEFSSLTTVDSSSFSSAFKGCSHLTSLSFPALTTSSFGAYTNQFNKMLDGVTGCTVHFPAAIQSTIENWADVTAGFGGTNTTVLFDL